MQHDNVIAFPPAAARRAAISASSVVQFADPQRHIPQEVRKVDERFAGAGTPPAPAAVSIRPLSEIGRNERLRFKRRETWRQVEAKLDYAKAWRHLHSTIHMAFDRGVLDQLQFCAAWLKELHRFDEPWRLDNLLLEDVRIAERELMLTPAPAGAMVDWKRKVANHPWYRLDGGSIEGPIERAIARDVAWLDAHPARQSASRHRSQD